MFQHSIGQSLRGLTVTFNSDPSEINTPSVTVRLISKKTVFLGHVVERGSGVLSL